MIRTVILMPISFVVVWAAQADWPQFLGPDRNAAVGNAQVARSWPEGGPRQLWEVSLSEGFGGASIHADEVFVLDRIEDKGDALRCFDLESGEEKWRMRQRNDAGVGPYSYVDRGYYTEQISRLLRYFPARQILVIKQEELRDHHNATVSSICEFLDIDAIETVEPIMKFVGSYTSPISQVDRNFLRELYRCEIKSLKRMLGWDCSDWLA